MTVLILLMIMGGFREISANLGRWSLIGIVRWGRPDEIRAPRQILPRTCATGCSLIVASNARKNASMSRQSIFALTGCVNGVS